MDRYSRLREAIRNNMQTQLLITQAVVKDVSGETCTVTIGKLDVTGVRLKATSVKSDGSMLVTPKAGSAVLVGSLSGDLRDLAVISVDEAEKVEISGEIIFNGGDNGGMTLSGELVKKLNAIENDVNSLKQALSTWAPVPQDGGASLKAAAASWSGQQLTVTEQGDIENELIRQ